MKKTYVFIFCVLFFGWSTVYGQGVRFSFQVGAAIPLGDFAVQNTHPDSGGFAKTGFDIRFVAERKLENNLIFGVNLGYSVFGMDKDGIKKFINPTNPEQVTVETQSFQNINLQVRAGFNMDIVKDKMGVVPYVDAGLGIFNSAYYGITDENGNYFLREGNSGGALLFSPGIDIWFSINEFMNLKIYGSYQFANYKVDEKYTLQTNSTVIKNKTANYEYNSISTGIGLTFVL